MNIQASMGNDDDAIATPIQSARDCAISEYPKAYLIEMGGVACRSHCNSD
ncbi:hypothetical protein C5167_050371 [Papaver somniferum]|uniref:Uncharacterized protein n=1 Tax=Papaver somniferum TaxID=3469 RepID=A0A4Y7KR80_PAPSO|nr:hypothetical protein C5167_050371 [Papaver somniferum]